MTIVEYCRNCGKSIEEGKTYVRIQVWRDNEIIRHLGHFHNYKCLDEWKIDRDLITAEDY